MKVPVEGVGHYSTQTHSSETGLLSDEGELQECHEKQNARQVAHFRKSLALTIYYFIFTVQPLPNTRCFSVVRMVMTACSCRSILLMKLPAAIIDRRFLFS